LSDRLKLATHDLFHSIIDKLRLSENTVILIIASIVGLSLCPGTRNCLSHRSVD